MNIRLNTIKNGLTEFFQLEKIEKVGLLKNIYVFFVAEADWHH